MKEDIPEDPHPSNQRCKQLSKKSKRFYRPIIVKDTVAIKYCYSLKIAIKVS